MKEDLLIKEITDLTQQWYTLIGPDHHKDRDCHWYIETKWSYGGSPEHRIVHNGYIIGKLEEAWQTYELALGRLKELLTKEIKEYTKDRDENDEENRWG